MAGNTVRLAQANQIASAFIPRGEEWLFNQSIAQFIPAGADWETRLVTPTEGVWVAVPTLALRLALELNPGIEFPECPYNGRGKSAVWQTLTAVKFIKQALDQSNATDGGEKGANH